MASLAKLVKQYEGMCWICACAIPANTQISDLLPSRDHVPPLKRCPTSKQLRLSHRYCNHSYGILNDPFISRRKLMFYGDGFRAKLQRYIVQLLLIDKLITEWPEKPFGKLI